MERMDSNYKSTQKPGGRAQNPQKAPDKAPDKEKYLHPKARLRIRAFNKKIKEMGLEIKATKVFEKNWEAINGDKRFIVNEGGSRSSKTYSLCQVIILYCLQNHKTSFSVVRASFPALRGSIMRDFFDILNDWNLYDAKCHNKTENIYKWPNGSYVEFFSADEPQKLRGRKRDFCLINEANELTYDAFQQINLRTSKKILVDYNPSSLS